MERTLIVLAAAAALLVPARVGALDPETVHVTYHVQEGKLGAFLDALRPQYPACRKLGLVLAQPHFILSGSEDGKPVVVEILTWRDGAAPDSVPEEHPEILAIWNRLNGLVEKRNGKPGIEIEPMTVVGPGEDPTAPPPK